MNHRILRGRQGIQNFEVGEAGSAGADSFPWHDGTETEEMDCDLN
jgi:hypothetical protein